MLSCFLVATGGVMGNDMMNEGTYDVVNCVTDSLKSWVNLTFWNFNFEGETRCSNYGRNL